MQLNPEIASQLNLSHGVDVTESEDSYLVRGPWFQVQVSKREYVYTDDDQPREAPTSPRQLRDLGDMLCRMFR